MEERCSSKRFETNHGRCQGTGSGSNQQTVQDSRELAPRPRVQGPEEGRHHNVVPIFYSDDSPPITGNFPDVRDQKAVEKYLSSHKELGAEFIEIEVDGKVTSIKKHSGYAVGVMTEPLPDGGGYSLRHGRRVPDALPGGHPHGYYPGEIHRRCRGRNF